MSVRNTSGRTGKKMAEVQTFEDEHEEIVMTPLKPKNGHQIIRVERTTKERLNANRVHYVAGGTYMGIVVNKAVNVKPKKSSPHTIRHFIAYVHNVNKELVREVRELRFWFEKTVSDKRREILTKDFFQDLMNPTNFPKDYILFVKRILLLVQSYLSIRIMEIEIRPFTENDELLDVHGQPMGLRPTSLLAATEIRASMFCEPVDADIVPAEDRSNGLSHEYQFNDDSTIDTSESSEKAEKKKKRKSKQNSDEVLELSSSLGAAAINGTGAEFEDSDDVEEIVKLRHEPRRGGSVPRTISFTRSNSNTSKTDKVIGTLEDAFPTALDLDSLTRITRMTSTDIQAIINDLCQSRAVAEVVPGKWIRVHPASTSVIFDTQASRKSKRLSQEPPREQNPRQHDFRMVAHTPILQLADQPTIAIVTSLFCEKLAVDAMIDFKTTYMRCKKGGEGQIYTVGKIGPHRVVSTKLSRIGSDVSAGNTITRLLGIFGRIDHVLLVGVAGAVNCVDDDSRHVRLGDVIVSLSDGDRPVYVQTLATDTEGTNEMQSWITPDPILDQVFDQLKRTPKGFYKKLDKFIREGLLELEPFVDMVDSAHVDIPSSVFNRPSSDTDHPYIQVGPSKIQLPNSGHPLVRAGSARDRRGPDRPIVHSGTVGAGRLIVRDPEARRRALNEFDVRAVDVGFRATLDSIVGNRKDSFGIVRGAADYSDGNGAKSNRLWTPYAALTAAASMKCIVLALPVMVDDNDDDDDDDDLGQNDAWQTGMLV